MSYFLQGLTMGLAYVAPIGLQNMFVINTALTRTRSRALLTALIVIFFDVTLALACFFGVGAIMERYRLLQMAVLLAGSAVVIFIGIGMIRSKAEKIDCSSRELSLRRTVSSACVVTWFNPQAIIDGSLMLGAFHVTLPAAEATTFISGVASASCLWFMGLTLVLSIFRGKFSEKVLRSINILCGAVILLYGAKLLYHFLILTLG